MYSIDALGNKFHTN